MRSSLFLSIVLAACGTSPDERPVTVEVVALSILAPSCGQVQCHSSTTKLEGYAFDTLDGAKDALRDIAVANGEGDTLLVEILHADGGDRMPPDSPLAEQDITLIEAWIDAGNPGL